jgi:hypothetical protein
LISSLQTNTALDLCQKNDVKIRFLIAEIGTGLTIQAAMEGKKIFQLRRTLGDEMLVKILCAIIKAFCDSVKAKDTLDAVDILELAESIKATYTTESVREIIYALNQAKEKGKIFYNSITVIKMKEILNDYMEKKSRYLESEVLNFKSRTDGSVNTEAYSRAVEEEARQERIDKRSRLSELKKVEKEKKEIKKVEFEIKKLLDK